MYKKFTITYCEPAGYIQKFLLIMKLTTLLLFVTLLQVSAAGFAQRINFTQKHASLKQVFKEINKQTGYSVFWSPELLKAAQPKDVNFVNMPINEVLDICFKDLSLTYVIDDKNVIIKERPIVTLAQEIVVKGKITDENGLPIPGAGVNLKGAGKGTSSDKNGNYTLPVPAGGGTLVFTFIGYTTQEIPVNNRTQIDVSMKPDVKALSEVVVVAYGTQKKVNLTGAITSIKGDDVNWKPVGQVSATLQGAASGVTVVQSGGQPGKDMATIRIRGIGTLNNNNPLVLVDGVQTDINNVDANDIATMSVLKDAAASSIYGVRAANGVILITTKRGASDKTSISYSNYFGWQNPARLSKYVGAQDFMGLANLLYTNSGSGAVYSAEQIAAYNDPNRDLNSYPDNYWLDKVLTGSGFQQQHSVSIGGGTEKNQYRFSTNYFDQAGLVKNMDYNRITVRLNTDSKISSKLDFSADISANISDQKEPQGTDGSAWYQFSQAAIANPLSVDRYTDGTWATLRGGQNPVRLQEEGGIYDNKKNLFIGNFKLTYKIIDGLTVSALASQNYQSTLSSANNKALDYINYGSKAILTLGTNNITKENTNYWMQNYQALVNYKKTFGKHSIGFLGGTSRLSEDTDYLYAFRNNIVDGSLSEIDAGAGSTATNKGNSSSYLLLSYFGRFNYSYDDKYLFEANLRRDGSSRFPKGSNWGWFPSFSAGWNIAKEDFMKSAGWIQELKLRGSWGKLGNDNPLSGAAVANYPYQSTFGYNNNYPFGGTLNSVAGQAQYTNAGLGWETTTMADIGIDLSILQNKLKFTFDYYNKTTDDMLYLLRIPATVGFDPSYQNAGSMQNKGFEFSVNYNGNIGEDFKYSIGGNISDVRSKVTDIKSTDLLFTDNNLNTTAIIAGVPLGAYYGYETEGIFQSAAQVAAHATQTAGVTSAGDLIYKDQNGDGVINALDRVYLGSDIPRYTYGFNLAASYKGFDFSALLQGVAKVDISTLAIEKAPLSSDGNFRTIHQDSWTPTNTDAAFPRLVTTNLNYVSSSFWIKSGAYLRVKSVQLGYTLNPAITKKIALSKLRLYASGQNLFTFSKLASDIDPESPNDNRYYPQVKTFTIGLNANF